VIRSRGLGVLSLLLRPSPSGAPLPGAWRPPPPRIGSRYHLSTAKSYWSARRCLTSP